MSSSWEIKTAEEFCFCVTDGTHDSPKPQKSGRKLITSKHLKENFIDFDSAYWISEEDYQKVIARSSVEQWDILYSMIGTIGLTYIERQRNVDYACKNMAIFKFNGDQEKALWTYYYLKSPHVTQYIKTNLRGSTQSYIPLGSLRKIPIVIPSKDIRSRIVNILSILDEKIAINNQINENLESQARLIFESYLVDKDNYLYSMLPDIASINEESFSYKDNWNFVNYLDTGNITKGNISEIQYINLHSTKLPSRAKRKVKNNDIVFSTVRPNQCHYGILYAVEENMLVSTGFTVIRPKSSNVNNELIYLCLTQKDFIEKMQQIAEQSASTFPAIKPSDIEACKIPIFDKEYGEPLLNILQSIFAVIGNNNVESKKLANMRDTLLPKLMSGEIDVSNIDI